MTPPDVLKSKMLHFVREKLKTESIPGLFEEEFAACVSVLQRAMEENRERIRPTTWGFVMQVLCNDIKKEDKEWPKR